MMQVCGSDRPGLAEPTACHGVGPFRRGAYAILPPDEALPVDLVGQPHQECGREFIGPYRREPGIPHSGCRPASGTPWRLSGRQIPSVGVRGSRGGPWPSEKRRPVVEPRTPRRRHGRPPPWLRLAANLDSGRHAGIPGPPKKGRLVLSRPGTGAISARVTLAANWIEQRVTFLGARVTLIQCQGDVAVP